MDLTQLANLGEFIGGVVVLVPVVYRFLQLRPGDATAQAAPGHALIAMAYRSGETRPQNVRSAAKQPTMVPAVGS